MSPLPNPTWFVGCGNMGGAIVEGLRAAGVDLGHAVAIRPSGRAVEGLRTVNSFGEAGPPPRLVILAVKPQQLDEVTPRLVPWLTSRATLLSILAGVEVASLRRRFEKPSAIVRALPNLPVSVRRGVVGLYSEDADEALRQQISEIFSLIGFAPWLASEQKLAAIGSVAGAGPAYVARFIAALASAGEAGGLHPDIARTVALETVFGTSWLAASTGETIDALVKRVASPNGTTEAGLAVLEPALNDLVARTIEAASRRGAELAAEARGAKLAEGPPLA